jgi:hypothetical protein
MNNINDNDIAKKIMLKIIYNSNFPKNNENENNKALSDENIDDMDKYISNINQIDFLKNFNSFQ